jgi:DNA-binding CsgD family transcriptional regulator
LRSKDKGPFAEAELAWLKRLRPHFDNVSRLHREMLHLKLGANMQQQALDRLDYPILLVYEGGLIAFLNQAAEHWLMMNGALGIKDRRLTSSDNTIQGDLDRLLSNAHRHRVSGACAVPRSLRRGGGAISYQMIVQPLNPLSELGSQWRRSVAMIVIADPLARRCLPAEWLRVLFGLTPAEAQMAMALAEGKALKEIAAQARITILTARSHLKQILNKTGARRQGELIRLVMTLPRINTESPDEGKSK